jgi:hypothetical protein
MDSDEKAFRDAVQAIIRQGRYPDHTSIRRLLGLPTWQRRSGLKGPQTSWRIEEVERAGYNWEASKSAQALVRQ